ncbi:uncharacterized protein IL334_000580 [Kwoniella shivajii]|uniref:N-acetyltransferase domain-containing protein n=1 Tax=Kwoniella shivajii TaxID=564305 RepID=A0ABZ1CTR6_9TREE|nr:hypothetical protein IL334_000580 [Kwoniella shivajii]
MTIQTENRTKHVAHLPLGSNSASQGTKRTAEAEDEQKVLNLYDFDPTPQSLKEHVPMHLYDINFIFPFQCLSSKYVRLEPLIPSKHLKGFLSLPPESWTHFGELGPYSRKTALEDIESYRLDPACLLLAVIDIQVEQAGEDGFAGVYALIEVNKDFMHALFGIINILPKYQKTHINTHAMYLTLRYLFEALHLIRVQYDAVTHNTASIKSAGRFGFQQEGICRNFNGLVPSFKRVKEKAQGKSQDMWVGSMTDHDWSNGGRRRLEVMMQRPVVDTKELQEIEKDSGQSIPDGYGHGK